MLLEEKLFIFYEMCALCFYEKVKRRERIRPRDNLYLSPRAAYLHKRLFFPWFSFKLKQKLFATLTNMLKTALSIFINRFSSNQKTFCSKSSFISIFLIWVQSIWIRKCWASTNFSPFVADKFKLLNFIKTGFFWENML